MGSALGVLVATLLGACASPGGAGVELGTGTTAFTPLGDGDEVYIVQGPQGGYHLDGSVRATGIVHGDPEDLSSPDNPTTVFRVLRAGEAVSGTANQPDVSYTQGLDESAEPTFCEMVGRRVYLNIGDDDDLVGSTLTVEVTLSDVDGRVLMDSREVFAVAHPDNQR